MKNKIMIAIFLLTFTFARFETLKELMAKFNTLTKHQQTTARITTQPSYEAVVTYWFLIYDEDEI